MYNHSLQKKFEEDSKWSGVDCYFFLLKLLMSHHKLFHVSKLFKWSINFFAVFRCFQKCAAKIVAYMVLKT